MGRTKLEGSRELVQITREIFKDQREAMEEVSKETGKTTTQVLRDVLDKTYKLPKKKP